MTKDIKKSIRPNPNGDIPKIHQTAYIDPSAQIIGNVHIGPEVFVGPNAVIRADETDAKGRVEPVIIEAQCNIQDSVIIHALAGSNVKIGQRTSLTHGCIIHGPCVIGQNCFIGFRAVVFKASLADGVFIGTGAVVQDVELAANTSIPPGAIVCSKADVEKVAGTTTQADCDFIKKVVAANLTLAKEYIKLQERK